MTLNSSPIQVIGVTAGLSQNLVYYEITQHSSYKALAQGLTSARNVFL